MMRPAGIRTTAAWAAVLAVLCITGGSMAHAEERNGPRIEFKEDRFDFGKVRQGDKAVHVFEFQNGGDEVLEVQKVQTS